MFKNLSMWRWQLNPEGEDAQNDTSLLRTNLRNSAFAKNLIEINPPENPGPGQLKKSGLAPVDDLIIEQCVHVSLHQCFLPLTQVIRERVIDNGAVKFEVEQRVKQIFMIDGRRVGRKELIDIKDEVIQSMLKDAPIREKRVFGIVTSTEKILVNATGKAAEEYINYVKSLFGDGNVRVRPAELLTWNPDCGVEPDMEDLFYLTEFAQDLLLNDDEESEKPFVSADSFCFQNATEQFAVHNAKEKTVDNLAERIKDSDLNWIEIECEHAVFKLNNCMNLKSIKLQDLEYTPENDEETGLSAAYYRFYLNFFINLFDTIVTEVAKVNQEDTDDV